MYLDSVTHTLLVGVVFTGIIGSCVLLFLITVLFAMLIFHCRRDGSRRKSLPIYNKYAYERAVNREFV